MQNVSPVRFTRQDVHVWVTGQFARCSRTIQIPEKVPKKGNEGKDLAGNILARWASACIEAGAFGCFCELVFLGKIIRDAQNSVSPQLIRKPF